ncbi:MAG: hypothetical protein LUF86_05290 [Clostridiales bacterium]|nr:hypothetical protein [Clostridiales bacterium]
MEQIDEKENTCHDGMNAIDAPKQVGKNHQKNQQRFQVVPFGEPPLGMGGRGCEWHYNGILSFLWEK